MKSMNLLLQTMLICIGLVLSLAAYSQEVKKSPLKQTSADKKETVYKPQAKAPPAVGKQQKATKQQKSGKKVSSKKKPAKQMKGKQKASAKQTPPTRYWVLKTNVPMLAVDVKNIAFEMQVNRKMSIELPLLLNFSDQSSDHALRIIALQPEWRWWLKMPGKGHFFGVHAHIAWFNLKWDGTRYQDEDRPLLGAGLSYGYKMNFGKHWGAEFNIGAGYANMKYNTYYNLENGAKIDARRRHYWGLTKLGASLVYRF